MLRNSRRGELIKTLKSNGRALIQIRPCPPDGGGGGPLSEARRIAAVGFTTVSPLYKISTTTPISGWIYSATFTSDLFQPCGRDSVLASAHGPVRRKHCVRRVSHECNVLQSSPRTAETISRTSVNPRVSWIKWELFLSVRRTIKRNFNGLQLGKIYNNCNHCAR